MKYKKYKLKDLIKIENGKDYKNISGGSTPVIGTGGVITYISEYIYDKESILLPRKGTLNNIIYVDGKFWTIDTMYWSKIISDKVYGKYLYLYLTLLDTSKRNTGSTLPSMTFNTYYSLDIYLPEFDLQKRIADYVFQLKYKIDNNIHINNNLEELMKTIYQRWFIEFEFPNKEVKPYKSSGGKFVYNNELKQEIPEGWKVEKVKELTNVVTGKEDANFSTENGKYKFFTCSNDTLQCDKPAYNGSAILIAGNGDFNVKHYTGSFNAYQRTYVLIPKNIDYYSSMYISAKNKIEAFKKGSSGSIVKFITKGAVEDINVIIPNDKRLLEELNSMLFTIEKNNNENDKLTELKNFLLPLLMNGQINVDDIEI